MGRFAGKVAVVTGGATGIGFAASRRLHAEGAVVVMAERRMDEGNSAVAAGSTRAVFTQTDVTERDQLDDMLAMFGDTWWMGTDKESAQ